MISTTWLKSHYFSLLLMALMAGTRVHHFGDSWSLPDASLAVFFLAGLFCRNLWLFAVLLVEAAVMDYVAIGFLSISDYCISPAYVFLIPTYATLWAAGWVCRKYEALNAQELVKTMLWAGLAATVAFAISNGSFYWFSGRFADLSFAQYLQRTGDAMPAYVSAALLYVLAGLWFGKITQTSLPIADNRKTV